MTTSFTKKLENIVETLLPAHIIDDYPKYTDFIRVYLRYLDTYYGDKIMYIADNCNPNTVYEELLDDYLTQYFSGIINLKKYELSVENKRRLLSLSKIIMNYKGTRKAVEALFKSLLNINIYGANEPELGLPIDKFNIIYTEVEGQLFTYYFQIDLEYDYIAELLDQIHPAGYQYFFQLAPFSFDDNTDMSDELFIQRINVYRYDGEKYYNGEIYYDHSSVRVIS